MFFLHSISLAFVDYINIANKIINSEMLYSMKCWKVCIKVENNVAVMDMNLLSNFFNKKMDNIFKMYTHEIFFQIFYQFKGNTIKIETHLQIQTIFCVKIFLTNKHLFVL